MTKVKSRLVKTVIDCPAERVSRGWISDGMSQPSGPQDQAKLEMKMQMMTMTTMEMPWGSLPSGCLWNSTPNTIAVATWHKTIGPSQYRMTVITGLED